MLTRDLCACSSKNANWANEWNGTLNLLANMYWNLNISVPHTTAHGWTGHLRKAMGATSRSLYFLSSWGVHSNEAMTRWQCIANIKAKLLKQNHEQFNRSKATQITECLFIYLQYRIQSKENKRINSRLKNR